MISKEIYPTLYCDIRRDTFSLSLALHFCGYCSSSHNHFLNSHSPSRKIPLESPLYLCSHVSVPFLQRWHSWPFILCLNIAFYNLNFNSPHPCPLATLARVDGIWSPMTWGWAGTKLWGQTALIYSSHAHIGPTLSVMLTFWHLM